jgi:hypothetical protein
MKHKHHIIPKYMGGGDEPENIIEVTIEEHAELHLDLYLKYGNWQDWRAFNGLMGVKDEVYEAHSVAMSGEGNPMYGLKGKDHPAYGYDYTEEQRERRSEYMKKNNPMNDPEFRKKVSLSRQGIPSKNWQYLITFSNESQIIVTNLKKWSRDNGYGSTYLFALKQGKRTKPYKGIVSVTKL